MKSVKTAVPNATPSDLQKANHSHLRYGSNQVTDRPFISDIVRESLRSGTIASLVIMPVGFLFRFLGLRIGHYGPKLGALLFGNVAEPWFQVLLIVQHFVIGWLSTTPLLLFLALARYKGSPVLYGAMYGAGYYVAVNSLFLPIAFGDPTPWQIGLDTLYPSLIGHIIFGISIAVTARRFVTEYRDRIIRQSAIAG
jgi:uncharacterized membrane protein YagU involved in acid resistance